MRNCGPKSVEDILSALLLALASPAVQHHLPMGDDEDFMHRSYVRQEKVTGPLTAQRFMAAIRGRKEMS